MGPSVLPGTEPALEQNGFDAFAEPQCRSARSSMCGIAVAGSLLPHADGGMSGGVELRTWHRVAVWTRSRFASFQDADFGRTRRSIRRCRIEV